MEGWSGLRGHGWKVGAVFLLAVFCIRPMKKVLSFISFAKWTEPNRPAARNDVHSSDPCILRLVALEARISSALYACSRQRGSTIVRR